MNKLNLSIATPSFFDRDLVQNELKRYIFFYAHKSLAMKSMSMV